MKNILTFTIPYWFNKKLECHLYWRIFLYEKQFCFSIFKLRKLVDILGYEDEWGFNKVKHFTLWRFKNNLKSHFYHEM